MPAIADRDSSKALFDALVDQRAELISFFVGVAVIGFYWTSHHWFFDDLEAVDTGYVGWTVVYLAFVAFLPFPIRLVGTYEENPVAWCFLALNLAFVSGMETMLLAHAQRAGLRKQHPTPGAGAMGAVDVALARAGVHRVRRHGVRLAVADAVRLGGDPVRAGRAHPAVPPGAGRR